MNTSDAILRLAGEVGELKGLLTGLVATQAAHTSDIAAAEIRIRQLEEDRSRRAGYIAGVGAAGTIIGSIITFLAGHLLN